MSKRGAGRSAGRHTPRPGAGRPAPHRSSKSGGTKSGSAKSGAATSGGTKRSTAKSGSAKSGASNPGNAKRRSAGAKRTSNAARASDATAPGRTDDAPPPGPFRLGAVPGATPGKWIGVWRERMPQHELELVPLEVDGQRAALTAGDVDAALVRLPIDADGLHVIALYEEVPVVVVAADSHLTAADELEAADLTGEVLIAPADDALGFTASGTVAPRFAQPATTADAVATVAAGVGILVVPMSLARLHHRKDVTYRPLREGPRSTVALAWVADRTTPLVETFVGIVRGRTANSSR